MGFDPGMRVALGFGVVTALSWFLFAEEDVASPVNSLVAGILGFTITYAVASLIAEALEEHAYHARRRDRSVSVDTGCEAKDEGQD